jgi:hypothetical protein
MPFSTLYVPRMFVVKKNSKFTSIETAVQTSEEKMKKYLAGTKPQLDER